MTPGMLCCGWDLGLVSQRRSIENAPIWLQYKILSPFWVSSSVLAGVNLMPWTGRTESCKNNSLWTFFSIQLCPSILPTTEHHEELCLAAAPWLDFVMDFMDCCFGSVFGAGVAPSLVTFLFNKYKFNKCKLQSSAMKLSYWSKKRKIDLRQKMDKDLSSFIFSMFLPLYALGPSDYHPDLHSGH